MTTTARKSKPKAAPKNACSPLAPAGAHGLSDEHEVQTERAGSPTRHDDKQTTPLALHHPHVLPKERAVTFVDVVTGQSYAYILPGHVKANLTSTGLTKNPRLLIDDDTLSAEYRQALAVLAAGTIIEHGTAKIVPTTVVKLLMQELDRQNALIAVMSRRLHRANEALQEAGKAVA